MNIQRLMDDVDGHPDYTVHFVWECRVAGTEK